MTDLASRFCGEAEVDDVPETLGPVFRLWFLGYNQYEIDRLLQGTDSLDIYLSFMASFLAAAGRVLRAGGIAVLVIGDENGQHVPLGERVWAELEGVVPLEMIGVETDAYDQSSKTTRVWGEQRRGRATPIVIVLRRVPARSRKVYRMPSPARKAFRLSKGFLTTTSDFAPKLRAQPFFMPAQLELVNGKMLLARLEELAKKKA